MIGIIHHLEHHMKPHILITNDDGISSPGIQYLWQALKNHARLTIVAPATEQSAVGLSITIRDPLRLTKQDWPDDAVAWSLSGTPADCVKLALSVLMNDKPDLIVSGINRGSNAGRNLLYSGTVGGAIEAVLNDIPGIAFSCLDYVDPEYHLTLPFIPVVVEDVLKNSLPRGTLLNVNFPEKLHKIKGFKLTRQGRQFHAADPDERIHPADGYKYFWLGCKLMEFEEHDDSDIAWLSQGYITAVPVHVEELTDHVHLQKNRDRFENLFPG